jgi:hypothetical protein
MGLEGGFDHAHMRREEEEVLYMEVKGSCGGFQHHAFLCNVRKRETESNEHKKQ